jgi:hypothetical protein
MLAAVGATVVNRCATCTMTSTSRWWIRVRGRLQVPRLRSMQLSGWSGQLLLLLLLLLLPTPPPDAKHLITTSCHIISYHIMRARTRGAPFLGVHASLRTCTV